MLIATAYFILTATTTHVFVIPSIKVMTLMLLQVMMVMRMMMLMVWIGIPFHRVG